MTPITAPTVPRATLRAVRVDFGGISALAGVDLDVGGATLTVVAGPNGAGKSTLLEVLAGVRPTTSGTRSVGAGARVGARVGVGALAFVPQRTAVSDRLPITVRDVVTVGAWGRVGRWRRLDAAARAAVDDALARLDVLDLARRPFAELSGGQRQRALLAHGLARGADLLLLDEPTTGLDAASAARIRATLADEVARGVTVVAVTHDTALLAVADRVLRLDEGRLVGDDRRVRGGPGPEEARCSKVGR